MNDCMHNKVYAPYTLLSNPPKKRWICNKCGHIGIDTIGTYDDEDRSQYHKLVKYFDSISEAQHD